MADDNKSEFKANFPNGFIWFVLAAFLLALMVQNFIDTKFAKVSFSYQLEHLVNLQLIQPEDSRKIALNDNLVTFSGKFRDRLTDEGKSRYKFLELLDNNEELTREKEQLTKQIAGLKEKVRESAEWFLLFSGTSLPREGYLVVDDLYNTPEHNNSIVIQSLPQKKVVSLVDLQQEFSRVKNGDSSTEINAFGASLAELVHNFRSPLVGIGNENLKQTLKNVESELQAANAPTASATTRLPIYQHSLEQLQNVVQELNKYEDHVRLGKLRSVRNYREAIDQVNQLLTKLEDNQTQLDKARQAVASVIWFYNNQELSTRALERQDPEQFNQWFLNAKEEWTNFNHNQGGIFKAPDQPLNTVLEKTFKSEEPATNYMSYIFTMLPVFLVIVILYFLFSRQMRGMGNSAMNFGKAPAKMLTKGSSKVTFKDVAGIDEAIEELQEIVDFLKSPQKFTALGGHIPKGVLCVGPPGTGKTLIAKAVAGEADRPFFSISGSDFVEMFVGVGASRIRDLFDQAKKNAPCIIFIDEIDAVGRHRGIGVGGGHDEREQTLNQLLVEMDGFDTNEGVILMAATNRPDVLDKALLRPGRFDRRVIIGLPDIKGRYDILKVHARKVKLDSSVDLMVLARSTPGCSGADLMNILNEAALLAARLGRTAVTPQDMVEARDKVLYGKERRSLELDENEKLMTAYHEAGHAVVSLMSKHGDPVDKITIIPRGMSLGATMFLPKKNRVSYWKNELIDQLAILMGGRCAEEVFVGDVSSGAKQDIEQATNLARSMVCEWGMSEKIGPVAYDERSSNGAYGMPAERKYSEDKAREIDLEVRNLLDAANNTAMTIIKEKKEEIELMAKMLIEFETLDNEDARKILNHEWDIDAAKQKKQIAKELHKEPAQPQPPNGARPSGTISPAPVA